MRKGFKSFGIILSIIIIFSGCSSRVEVQENEKDIVSIEESLEEDTKSEEETEEAISEEDTKNTEEASKEEPLVSKPEESKEEKVQEVQSNNIKDKEVASSQKPQTSTLEVKSNEAPKVEKILAEQTKTEEKKEEEATPRGKFKDGTHNGSGSGHDGDIKVRVKVENGYITQIDVLSHEDTKNIAENAFSSLRSNVINNQTTDVNVVSGATHSSKGFIEGVRKALN